jgi:hypothetical protein
MAPATGPVTTMALGTMLRDITGDPTDIVTTADLIGATDTGGTTAGIGIEIPGTARRSRRGLGKRWRVEWVGRESFVRTGRRPRAAAEPRVILPARLS